MARRSPTLAGFKAVFSRPSFTLAEIAWRWSFGSAAALLLTLSVIEYLDSLPVTYRDELMFRTRQPSLISRAIAHIVRGSSPRLIAAALVLAMALSLAWIVLGALGRSATLRALLDHLHRGTDLSPLSDRVIAPVRLRSLIGLNFFRVAATLAAAVGCLSAFLLGGAVSSTDDPSPGSATLIFFFVVLLVWLAWSTLNWFLSLATVFVVVEGRDTFGAIVGAVDFCRRRTGSVFAVNTWFGLAHFVLFFIASSAVAFPLGFIGLLPKSVALGGVLLIALLYFAAADFLYVGRMAAYVSILLEPEVVLVAGVPIVPPGPNPHSVIVQTIPSIDRSELILSDLPNLIPET